MLTNADITIYNKVVVNGANTWLRTQIKGVSWYNNLGMALQSGAVVSSDIFAVRIPNTSGYVSAKEYASLTDRTGKWTVQKDDIVCRGLITTAITGLATLTANKEQAFKVTSFSDNRRGGQPHIRIGGV